MAATEDVIEKGELENTKVSNYGILRKEMVTTHKSQETEKDQESDNKEGEEKKDECNSCKNDQEVVFIQVRDPPQSPPPASNNLFSHGRILASL